MPPAIGRTQKTGLLRNLSRGGGGGKWYDTRRSGGSRAGGTEANRLEVGHLSILQGERHGVEASSGRVERLALLK
jgi:hypothetical protein